MTLSMLLHFKEKYCAISCANSGILHVFFKYSNPTFIPIYLNCHLKIQCILQVFSKLFYSIVIVYRINFTPNKSQRANSYANSDKIYAFFKIFKPFFYTGTIIGNYRFICCISYCYRKLIFIIKG